MPEFVTTADGRMIPTSRIEEIVASRTGGVLHTAKLENGEALKLFDLPIAGAIVPNMNQNLKLQCCAGSVGDGWVEPIIAWRITGDLQHPEPVGFSNNDRGVTSVIFDAETGMARDEELGFIPVADWLAIQREFAQKRAA